MKTLSLMNLTTDRLETNLTKLRDQLSAARGANTRQGTLNFIQSMITMIEGELKTRASAPAFAVV